MSGIRRAVQRSPLAALNGENSRAKVQNVREDSSASSNRPRHARRSARFHSDGMPSRRFRRIESACHAGRARISSSATASAVRCESRSSLPTCYSRLRKEPVSDGSRGTYPLVSVERPACPGKDRAGTAWTREYFDDAQYLHARRRCVASEGRRGSRRTVVRRDGLFWTEVGGWARKRRTCKC